MEHYESHNTFAYDSIATVTTPALAFIASSSVATLSVDVTSIEVKFTLIQVCHGIIGTFSQ